VVGASASTVSQSNRTCSGKESPKGVGELARDHEGSRIPRRRGEVECLASHGAKHQSQQWNHPISSGSNRPHPARGGTHSPSEDIPPTPTGEFPPISSLTDLEGRFPSTTSTGYHRPSWTTSSATWWEGRWLCASRTAHVLQRLALPPGRARGMSASHRTYKRDTKKNINT
jgi:hypothetical protein